MEMSSEFAAVKVTGPPLRAEFHHAVVEPNQCLSLAVPAFSGVNFNDFVRRVSCCKLKRILNFVPCKNMIAILQVELRHCREEKRRQSKCRKHANNPLAIRPRRGASLVSFTICPNKGAFRTKKANLIGNPSSLRYSHSRPHVIRR